MQKSNTKTFRARQVILGMVLFILVLSMMYLSYQVLGNSLKFSDKSTTNEQTVGTLSEVTSYQLAGDIEDRSTVYVEINGRLLRTELVARPDSITQGLSGRSQIGADGMLFALSQTNLIPTFWMKDMQFPIDIIWIGGNGSTVVDVSANLPTPKAGTPLSDLPKYSPSKPASMVLEVDAGESEELGVVAGTAVRYFVEE